MRERERERERQREREPEGDTESGREQSIGQAESAAQEETGDGCVGAWVRFAGLVDSDHKEYRAATPGSCVVRKETRSKCRAWVPNGMLYRQAQHVVVPIRRKRTLGAWVPCRTQGLGPGCPAAT